MLAILIQPLVGFGLFLCAALLGRFILSRIPEGRLKKILSKRYPIHAQTDAERRDWTPVFLLFGVSILLFSWVWWLGH